MPDTNLSVSLQPKITHKTRNKVIKILLKHHTFLFAKRPTINNPLKIIIAIKISSVHPRHTIKSDKLRLTHTSSYT